MYPRNAASPPRIAIGPVVQISDGAVQTAGVSVKVIPQGGTEASGGGTVAYSADGVVVYTPTQGETDYTAMVLVASKAGCIPATVTVVTSASGTAGYAGLDWGKIAAPTTTVALTGTTISATQIAASVTAAVTVGVNNDKANYALSTAANDLIIDTFLAHTLSKGAANTIERAFWQSSKTSASLTGEVLASGANTATAFLTDIAIDDFAGQVLAIVSGVLTGESRAISSVVSGVVTLQKPLTGIPAAGTEFVVVPSQVYSVSEIQAGLATAAALATLTTYVDTEVAAIKTVTDRLSTGLVADGAVYQFTANMLELAPAGGGGAGDASQTTLLQVQSTVNGIASSLSGVPITATGRIADGGTISLYCGDDLRVRSGTQLTLTVTDVGGSIYSRLNTIGTGNLAFGASRRGLPVSAISGSIASLASVGSGASQTVQLVVEIDNAGGSLQPAEDYEWQIESEQTQGSEIDQLVEMAGILVLRRRTV